MSSIYQADYFTFCHMTKKKNSAILPLGFAEQVLDLEVKLE